MKTNALHQVIVSEDDMVNVLYKGNHINSLVVDNPKWIKKYNNGCIEYGLSGITDWVEESNSDPNDFIQENLADWYMPDEFATLDITSTLLAKCSTEKQKNRVLMELAEFEKRNMIVVLRWMAYFVATLRANDMIWGVGRGSSVSSYVLFLLEVHRVDSLEYDLDIKEFLK